MAASFVAVGDAGGEGDEARLRGHAQQREVAVGREVEDLADRDRAAAEVELQGPLAAGQRREAGQQRLARRHREVGAHEPGGGEESGAAGVDGVEAADAGARGGEGPLERGVPRAAGRGHGHGHGGRGRGPQVPQAGRHGVAARVGQQRGEAGQRDLVALGRRPGGEPRPHRALVLVGLGHRLDSNQGRRIRHRDRNSAIAANVGAGSRGCKDCRQWWQSLRGAINICSRCRESAVRGQP
ncbi:hypothetical protein OV079_00340 [Nannocystis pusilla]|uniref:Uncharacterized protein n=1 Tax=Nannocystis pusilla TaxID=889268 RepID=A0A9X3ENU0_9BACT|nr:hypothetical protein [Nannocystis pusilla]MCY1004041.1 hypothetical protein [Nannocystis pusilla]